MKTFDDYLEMAEETQQILAENKGDVLSLCKKYKFEDTLNGIGKNMRTEATPKDMTSENFISYIKQYPVTISIKNNKIRGFKYA